jgi:hypothetical protein
MSREQSDAIGVKQESLSLQAQGSEMILKSQDAVLVKLKSEWPFQIWVGKKGKSRPYLRRGKAKWYDSMRETTFIALKRKRMIERILVVNNGDHKYDVYELARPPVKRARPKRKKKT